MGWGRGYRDHGMGPRVQGSWDGTAGIGIMGRDRTVHGSRDRSPRHKITGRDTLGRDNGKYHGTGSMDRVARGIGLRKKGPHVTGAQGTKVELDNGNGAKTKN
jgi:hypothetical protein